MQTIGTRIVIRNLHAAIQNPLRLAMQEIGFTRPLPTNISGGLVVYVDDDGTFDSAQNPSVAELNPERVTLENTDGNVSVFLSRVALAMKEQKKKCVVFTSDDGKQVVVRRDGTVTYGCTTVSKANVERIIAARESFGL